MTIDGRVIELVSALPASSGGVETFRLMLRSALMEVARDQREACAEAVEALDDVPNYGFRDVDAARQAVLAAEVK